MPDIREFLMPDLGEGLTEGEIVRWLVATDDVVAVDQPIAEISTEKAVVEVPTPFAGRVARLHGAPGSLIAVGTPLISIEVSTVAPAAASGNVLVGYGTNEAPPGQRRRVTPAHQGAAQSAHVATAATPPASPLVRRLAEELGIDVSGIAGTGPGGIVTRADLDRAREERGAAAPAGTQPPTPTGTRTPLTGVHRIAADRLTRSHRETPVASAFVGADATRLVELRAELGARADGVRVTPFAIMLRLCVLGLRRFPRLNAHFDSDTNEVVTFDDIHLGVAVQTERGLVVPVIRDAQRKPVLDIAAELNRLAAASRVGGLHASELRGSTFTVSNFGAFGVDAGTAIINPPEAAILGIGQIAKRPWVVGDAVVPRMVVQLSLMFDHRVSDGGVAGGFLRHVADLVEAPEVAMTDD